MSKNNTLIDFHWDVNKYKANYDPEYWDLCRTFMEINKTKYPEQKLVNLTEAFYQIGVYGSSYDPKTTRMISALSIEVLENFLQSHPCSLRHPFDKSAKFVTEVVDITGDDSPSRDDKSTPKTTSIWDVAVDQSIIANVLTQSHLSALLKGFVIIYDVRKASTMNDNKVSILEESFKRSKFGPCHWDKLDTHNNICPIRLALKYKGTVLAEAVGNDDKALRIRLAQATLSKLAKFSPGIEAKWSYYRDGRMPDVFDHPNPRKCNIYKIIPRSQFRAMEEITSFIDTFANSDSFAEVIFGMDFSKAEKTQIMEYTTKSWGTKLTYRTVNKMGAKNKTDTHVCVYHIRTGEEMRRWLDQCGGENERYRLVPPGQHRRAGKADVNVREVLKSDAVNNSEESETEHLIQGENANISLTREKNLATEKNETQQKQTEESVCNGEVTSGDLEKLLNGFILFYDAKKNSEIDKDDWFSALYESFKISDFGPLEVFNENIRPLRTRCIFKWKNRILASAEGLTETQAKTAATLQLISKLEPFTYIIQAKEEYFFQGKVPPFMDNPDQTKSDLYRVVRRKDLPNYYSIFQTIDEFIQRPSFGEIVFGPDFTWELKNEIVVYLKAKGVDYRYFTLNDQKPWTHMAVYHIIQPKVLKNYLLSIGGENDKYKLIPPQKAEPISDKTAEEGASKVSGKPIRKFLPAKVAEKRKQPEHEPSVEETEGNKIQIKLKSFKKDKIDYPEDTGGEFPGLILWIGIKKNSLLQKNLFCILLDSFKMSKYGELFIEESEENVWGRKEPFKKCVIKSNRKVLAVGLGESKTEAKHSSALQVLRRIRNHCYTIKAKDSYFKEGKATPYDFKPDTTKQHVYRVVSRNKFKDKDAFIRFVNDFSRKVCSEEVIFGEDFTYDEREYILQHCRDINLNYRLMKCQSIGKKYSHTHFAIYHQRPLPTIKAELMEAGGEDDKYSLIPPGGKICSKPETQEDLWPDTLENVHPEASSNSTPASATNISAFEKKSSNKINVQITTQSNITSETLSLNFGKHNNAIDDFQPDIQIINNPLQNAAEVSNQVMEVTENNPNNLHHLSLHNVPLDPQMVSMTYGSIYPQAVPFGISSVYVTPSPIIAQPCQEMPLTFGPQPHPAMCMLGNAQFDMSDNPVIDVQQVPIDSVVSQTTKEVNLKDNSSQKRQAESQNKDNMVKKVCEDNKNDGWSRKVFVSESKEKEKLRQGDFSRKKETRNESADRITKRLSPEKDSRGRISPGRDRRRLSPGRDRQRISPGRDRRRISLERDRRRISPERNRRINSSRENIGSRDRSRELRIVKNRDSSIERYPVCRDDFSRGAEWDDSRNRNENWRPIARSSRRSPVPHRGEENLRRNLSPSMHFRDLSDNISERLAKTIIMFKYVKQDSTVQRDPFGLLKATRSLNDSNIDFDFYTHQISIDEWQASIELVTSDPNIHPLVGEGFAPTESEASLIAAQHAVHTIQQTCWVIEPNYRYFAEGGLPDFIIRKSPIKTPVYEIMQNMDPNKPLERHTVEFMYRLFLTSDVEDLFFLATDFSYLERVLVIEVANQMNLWWRLFGPRHPDARPDDLVSTQHICVFKPELARQLARELFANGGVTEKYTLVEPITWSRREGDRPNRGFVR